ncbi:MAG: hypothetical protein AAFN10_09675, partial [Bacteroidota bacterium]
IPPAKQECHCHSSSAVLSTEVKKTPKATSIWAGVLLVLIPKCPLCVLTYSGAVGLCGAANYSSGFPTWSILLTLAFLAGMFVMLQYNFKGNKTLVAEFLLACGGATLLSYMMFDLAESTFYISTVLVLFSAWLNGSFMHFYFALINKS